MAFCSPGKTLIASAATDRRVILWDAKSLAVRAMIPVDEHEIRALAFTADGSRLYAGLSSGDIRWWSLQALDEAMD